MDLQEWRPVPGYEGFYEVSDLGYVRSARRCQGTRPGLVLQARIDHKGYRRVYLRRPGERRVRRVHHLVLDAFVGMRPEGLEARHLDGDSLNNLATNLAWGTHSQNMYDSVDHGTHANARRGRQTRGR